MNSQKNRAFTLLEIIAVITIIVILIALLSPALNTARQQAKKQEAKAMVGSLEVAINMYYTDQGSYPGALSDLMSYSPYMDNKHYEGGNFMDPWDNAYNYPGAPTHNPDTFDVWSNGLDEASGNDDDIGNW